MKQIAQYIVPSEYERLSISMALRLSGASQNLRRKLKREGKCFCNGAPCEWNKALRPHDELTVFIQPSPSVLNWEPYDMPLHILYEDEHLIAINKPPELLVHPTSTERHQTLANALLHHYACCGETAGFHPLHRLDKNTSGIVIIAKTALIQHNCYKQRSLQNKTYLALVEGIFPTTCAHIAFPIQRDPLSIIKRNCGVQGQEAHTDICCIGVGQTTSLLQCLLHTGRTHQIRVHCAQLGYPLAGDDLYGGSLHIMQRQALHAYKLDFYHPLTKEQLHFTAPLPKDMLNAIIRQGIEIPT